MKISTNPDMSHASKNQSNALLRRGSLVRIQPRSPQTPVTATCPGSATTDHNLAVPLASNPAISGGVRLDFHAGDNLAVSLPYNSSDPIVFELPFHPDWQEISASDQIMEALEQMTFEAGWEWFKRARWDGYFGGGL